MKTNKLHFLASFLMITSCLLAGEKDPKIRTSMPPGIHYSKAKNGAHRYEIRNIFSQLVPREYTNEKLEKELPLMLPNDLKIADEVTFDVDLKKRIFALLSPRRLTSEELTKLLFILAGDRLVPSWHELVAREFPKSKMLKDHQYVAEEISQKSKENVTWSERKRFDPLRMPLLLGNHSKGHLELTPTARYCMCHSYFTLRILDHQGGVVWKAPDDLLKGLAQVALVDSDGDGWQEILVECDDHDKKKRFIFTHQTEK